MPTRACKPVRPAPVQIGLALLAWTHAVAIAIRYGRFDVEIGVEALCEAEQLRVLVRAFFPVLRAERRPERNVVRQSPHDAAGFGQRRLAIDVIIEPCRAQQLRLPLLNHVRQLVREQEVRAWTLSAAEPDVTAIGECMRGQPIVSQDSAWTPT